MHILICSDGTGTADNTVRLGGRIAQSCGAKVTLLGIAEQPQDSVPLREALLKQANSLNRLGLNPGIASQPGDPIEQILQQTRSTAYDLAVIGARSKEMSGRYWRSQRTYELIKSISPPILVANGDCDRLSKFLVCTGGKRYIDAAVQLTGQIAACAGASVTLLHVMAEPPAIYADLVRREEDVDALLGGGSELGDNLRAQKESLEKLGVPVEVRMRHGIVLDEIFAEQESGGHDVIVTGSSQARGALRHYIMGDITRSIVNRAECPVLVARPTTGGASFWISLKRAFSSSAA